MPKDVKEVIKSVANQDEQEKKKIEELIQLVVFELDKEEYGVGITDLKEIIKIPEITPIPNAPDFISGILNLRGKIVVVVDLEKRFNLTREFPTKNGPKHIIITEVAESTFGVIVDEVTEVLRVPVSTIRKAPALVSSKIHADYIKGVAIIENLKIKEKTSAKPEATDKVNPKQAQEKNRLIILIDLPKMLGEKELLELGKMTREVKEKI